jgi:hypothetical protein
MMGNCSFEPRRRTRRPVPIDGGDGGRGRDVGTWSTDRGSTVDTEFVNSDWPHPAHLIWPHAQDLAQRESRSSQLLVVTAVLLQNRNVDRRELRAVLDREGILPSGPRPGTAGSNRADYGT